MRGPQPEHQRRGRVAYLYSLAVVEEIDFASHKSITLLTARVTRIRLAMTCLAVQSLARQRQASPRLAA
jgi:hypothetical protein